MHVCSMRSHVLTSPRCVCFGRPPGQGATRVPSNIAATAWQNAMAKKKERDQAKLLAKQEKKAKQAREKAEREAAEGPGGGKKGKKRAAPEA